MSCWQTFRALPYSTVKLSRIEGQPLLAILHLLIQIIITLYVLLYVIWFNHGYQAEYPVAGSVITKVKGSAFFNDTTNGVVRIWDGTDVVFPFLEDDALFITTGILSTPFQTQGVCTSPDHPCDSNKDCSPMKRVAHGTMNGRCVDGLCEMWAWCPVEEDENRKAVVIEEVEHFQVFVKASVRFPTTTTTANRLLNTANGTTPTRGFNLFSVKEMLNHADIEFEDVKDLGAIVGATIEFDCDLDDPNWNRHCQPAIDFFRIDAQNTFSRGFNFRRSDYYFYQDSKAKRVSQRRDLAKVYGIRFIFFLTGIGRQFSGIVLVTQLANALALLSVATLTSDFVASYLFPKRRKKEFTQAKYEVHSYNPDGDFIVEPGETDTLIKNP
eukprot:gnl/Hemi2/19242_TR6382_c0_g2_i1.p1 gnl/Hemi2/19242_TR6382_c0_g2~~gnl/Hemi2/19242_TR6382_c0_g2_i1.p1  ORF type:complete len:383 (-),score=87.09 gnl/Hemi2/19242_TR6382_c0_g2_i1:102-1250(-)